jgi:membrane-associated protease RseP (regulator of RpoE activity)
MTGPKHLWSGDWESESGAATTRPEPLVQPPEPTPPPPSPPAPSFRRPRPRLPRTGLLVTLAVLVLAGGAYAVSSLADSGTPAEQSSQPAWLGVQLLGAPTGALVAEVVPGSPADAAGLRPGDVITEIQGRSVDSPVNVTNAIAVLAPGETVDLKFQRGPRTYTASAKLAARPARIQSP